MDSSPRGVVALIDAAQAGEPRVGAKAVRLAKLVQAGLRVPHGFCISTVWYEEFVRHNRLTDDIQLELGRKPLAAMRWEEIWDAAPRIRCRFLAGQLPQGIAAALHETIAKLPGERPLAVRSSARGIASSSPERRGSHCQGAAGNRGCASRSCPESG